MEGESNGHLEGVPSAGTRRKATDGFVTEDGARVVTGALVTNDPRETIAKAVTDGVLTAPQAKALTDLVSRMAVLGFEAARIISVLVNNIATERSDQKRRELVLQLREYLEGDGLAKDLIPPLSGSFSIR